MSWYLLLQKIELPTFKLFPDESELLPDESDLLPDESERLKIGLSLLLK